MRLLLSTALCVLAFPAPFLAASLPAFASDISARSTLDAVTVYRSGAEISRIVVQEFEAGSHTLIIKDLPAETIPGSIRVEGKANGDLRIGSVDAKRVSLLSGDAEAQNEERRELEIDLERLGDAMDQLRAEIETKEAQKTLITNLTSLPNQPPGLPRDGGSANQDWSKLLDLIGTSLADVQADIIKTRIAMRELGRKIEDVQKQLAELSPKQEERTEVRVSVEADASLKADLIIKYQVGNAGWRPYYDARLETGSTSKPPVLMLTRRATIQQHTGETWTNVALQLSTSQSSGRSSAPTLLPLTVDFEPPPVARPMVGQLNTRNKMSAQMQRSAPAASPTVQAEQAQDAGAERKIVESGGQLERTAFQASFGVPGRVTVPNTGEAKRVKLDDQEIKPSLNVRAVPSQDTNAYLYAKLEMPKAAPYLAGPVSLFRDGGFVGTGRLPNLAPGADHELGFGSDPSVIVKYHILAEKRGETGIISSSATDQRNFRIDVTNQHERPIDVVLIDQMPVSVNDEISVELLGPAAPTKKNFEDKRGLLAWQFPLEGAQKRSISFGYTISWPTDKKVIYRHRQ